MTPRQDNQRQPEAPETEVQISHEEREEPPVTAPPLPIAGQPPAEPVVRQMPPQTDYRVEPPPQQPVVPPPVRPEEFYDEEERDPRRWLTIVLLIIFALLVATAVVLAGRWIYQQVRDDETKPTPLPPASDNQGQVPQPPLAEQPVPAPQPTAPGAFNGTRLPNNGPGEVLALFVGVTIAISGLHYIYQLRRGI